MREKQQEVMWGDKKLTDKPSHHFMRELPSPHEGETETDNIKQWLAHTSAWTELREHTRATLVVAIGNATQVKPRETQSVSLRNWAVRSSVPDKPINRATCFSFVFLQNLFVIIRTARCWVLIQAVFKCLSSKTKKLKSSHINSIYITFIIYFM